MSKDELIEDFKNFCTSALADEDDLADQDWFALSLGWFLSKGVTLDLAWSAAIDARYKYHYWN